MSNSSPELTMILRAHDQLVEEMREQRRINEKLNESINEQGRAVHALTIQVQHLSKAIENASAQEVRIDGLEKRIEETERKNAMWQRRFALIGSAALITFEIGRIIFLHMVGE